MKRSIVLLLVFISASAFAQNIQLHYDAGQDRDYFTSTIEMYKTDKWGANFFFVDFDYNNEGNKSISLSYFEIARYVNLPWVEGLSATVQYNDGYATWGPLGNVFLAGLSYPVDLGLITLSTDILYRADYQSSGADAQLTAVWFKPFFNGKVTFTGFLDIWTKTNSSDNKDIVLLTEPQLWYNFNENLAVGSEIEISHRFLPPNENGEYNIRVMPTAAIKWTF